MYQVFKTSQGIKISDVPTPSILGNEILVKTYFSLISTGTETASLKKNNLSASEKFKETYSKFEKVKEKLVSDGFKATFDKVSSKFNQGANELQLNPFGYSVAGEVIACGIEVRKFKVGDRVACAGSGIAAHAEFVRIPVNLAVKVADSVPLNSASFTTVGSIALHGIRRSEVKPGENILIIGLGLIGQLAVQIAKAWGLNVIGIDLIKGRVSLANKLGCDLAINGDDPDLQEKIFAFTDGYGVDSAIIYAATKSSDPSNLAMKFSKQKGRVVVVGAVGMELDRELMYKKELDFVISTSYGPGRYDDLYELKGIDYPFGYVRWTENRNMQEFVSLLEKGKIDTETLISGTFDIMDADKAFESLIANPVDNLAVLLKYDVFKNDEKPKIVLSSPPIHKTKLNVAIIGAGGFAQRTHLPNLSLLADLYNIYGIADLKPEQAKKVGDLYGAMVITCDYKELISDENVDMIIITTQHNSHADLVSQSLKAGKAVLVEKPLAINRQQYQEVVKNLSDRKDSNLFVGFNRRYSPFIIKSKELFVDNISPLYISYRINAGFISDDHWIQDPKVGGGRLIGEVCHFIDLINYLVDSELTGFHISSVPVDGLKVKSSDNYAITLSYRNGSIGQINYISIGSKNLSKEKIEIHSGNKSIVIDDFVSMSFYGYDSKNMSLKDGDKGHKKELEEIYKKLNCKPSLIPDINLDLIASEVSIRMVESLNGSDN